MGRLPLLCEEATSRAGERSDRQYGAGHFYVNLLRTSFIVFSRGFFVSIIIALLGI